MFKKHKTINKVSVTEEAVFDYEFIISRQIMPKKEFKVELGEYLDWMNKNGKLLYTRYFKVKYYDEHIGKMLYAFLYRGRRFCFMQNWKLCGLCRAKDFDEAMEAGGLVKTWLKSPIDLTDIPYSDWVSVLREREEYLRKFWEEC